MTNHRFSPDGQVSTLDVLIVDDHPIARSGIRQALEGNVRFRICGEAATVAETLEKVTSLKPDLLTLDLTLGTESSLAHLDELKALAPEMGVLVISMFDEKEHGYRAMSQGADGYIQKNSPAQKLVEFLETIANGDKAMGPKLAGMFLQGVRGTLPQGGTMGLSKREFEVYQLMGVGRANREIAEQMGVSPRTVEAHKAHIKTKLGVSTVAEIARSAAQFMQGGKSPES